MKHLIILLLFISCGQELIRPEIWGIYELESNTNIRYVFNHTGTFAIVGDGHEIVGDYKIIGNLLETKNIYCNTHDVYSRDRTYKIIDITDKKIVLSFNKDILTLIKL